MNIANLTNVPSQLSNDPSFVARTYYYHLPNIVKTGAFNDYLYRNFSFFEGFSQFEDIEIFYITFVAPLTTEQLENVTAAINAYQDPDYWLSLFKVESSGLYSQSTNSSTPVIASTFIMTPNDVTSADIRLDSIKTIIHYHTDHVEDFVNFDDSSVNIVTISVFDITRNALLDSQDININYILNSWKNKAIANETGTVDKYVSHQVFGLHSILPDFDCIWQFKMSVSNPNVMICLNGLERIFYTLNTN